MIKYQGDDIAFKVELFTDTTESEHVDLDAKAEIIVLAYTDGCVKKQFSKALRDGYEQLTRVSATEYSGIIDSDATKLMREGPIIMEIKVSDSAALPDGKFDRIHVFSTSIMLHKSQSKNH